MTINLTPSYYATVDTLLLGYVGETNSRAIYITNYTVDGCDKYRMRFSYSDGIVYETDIINSTVELVAGIMRMAGDVSVQICAVLQDGDEYTFVKKSNIMVLKIGNALDDNVAPVPTPDVSVGILEKVQSLTDVCIEAKIEAQNSADECQQIQADINESFELIQTIVTTEAQQIINLTTFADGTPLKLSEVMVNVTTAPMASPPNTYTARLKYNGSYFMSGIVNNVISTKVPFYSGFFSTLHRGMRESGVHNGYSIADVATTKTIPHFITETDVPYVDEVEVSVPSGYTFAVGTKIEIYGIRGD